MLLISSSVAAAGLSVQSFPVNVPITVDGQVEKIWQQAKPLSVELNELPYKPNNGYEGLKETTIEIRSMYDAQYVYFVYRWYDPTKDLGRFPWQKNSDGSWTHLANKDSTLHENTYYEDKIAVYWDINEKGFVKKGCDKSCHMVEKGMLEGVKDTSSGRHFTKTAGETLDEWQWKATRSNPLFQLDDGYVDHEHETNGKWGRKTDMPKGGGYYANTNKTGKPAWMNGPKVVPNPDWVLDSEKVPFVDTFKSGDRIGGIVVSPFKNSRADVTAKGEWQDDYWTLEIKRKRITNYPLSSSQDVQFNDLNKTYYFGITAFDNSQINHLYHKKSIKLTFKQ